jgi:hypothetical protein
VDITREFGSWPQPGTPTYIIPGRVLRFFRGDSPPPDSIFIAPDFGIGDEWAIPNPDGWDLGWSSGDLAGILNYTNVEGTPRQIEFYKKPHISLSTVVGLELLHTSNRSATWRYNFSEGNEALLVNSGGALSLIKWEFKYSKSTPHATFSGVKTGFMSTL